MTQQHDQPPSLTISVAVPVCRSEETLREPDAVTGGVKMRADDQYLDNDRKQMGQPPFIRGSAPASLDVSVVIPVYNSECSLPPLAERLARVLDGLGRSWEVIFVNDCSPDDSWRVIDGIVRERPGFRGILLARNVGQARATLCGIKVTTGDIVVTMDDDLQHEPEALPRLLAELDSDDGYDGLFAWFPDKQHHQWRNLGSRLIRYINAQAFGLGTVKISSYRLMRRHVADFIRVNNSSMATPGAMMLAASRHIKSVPIEHRKRTIGRSNYTLGRQLRAALTNLIGVSLLPLRLISMLGLVTAALSALMVLVTLVRYFTTGFGVPGWTTLVILVTFFSGLILLSLGVIGEYLVRVLRELQYTDSVPVRRTTGFGPAGGIASPAACPDTAPTEGGHS